MTAEQVRALLAATPTAPQYQPYPTDRGFDLVSAEARSAASALLGTDDPALVDAVVSLAARTKRLVEDAERWIPEERAPIADSGTFADWEPSCAVANGILMASYDGHARLPRSAITALGALARGEDAEAKGLTASTFLPIARPEVMLALASAPLRPAAAVRGAAALVGAVLDAGLYTRESLIRSFTYEFTTEQCLLGPGAVFPTPRGPSISLGVTHNLGRDISGLCWSPEGGRPRVLGRDTEPFLNPSSIPPDRIVAAFQQLIADGPPPWDPAKATRLAEGIGWSPAEATLLLAGLPYFPVREKNFLPKPLRELLGLSVAEAATARSSLRDRSPVLLIQMLSAGAQDPLRVVTEGIDVDAIVGAWQRRFGKRRLLLPSALVTEADSVFPEFGASRVRRLSRGHVSGYSSVTALLWLASRLDGTDPLRAQVADWFEAVRDGLPRCVFSWNEWPRRPIVRPLLGLPPRASRHLGWPAPVRCLDDRRLEWLRQGHLVAQRGRRLGRRTGLRSWPAGLRYRGEAERRPSHRRFRCDHRRPAQARAGPLPRPAQYRPPRSSRSRPRLSDCPRIPPVTGCNS